MPAPRGALSLRAILSLLLALAVLSGSALPAWAGQALSAGGHRFRWDRGDEPEAQRLRRNLPAIRAHVAQVLGFPLRGGPAEIVVVSGHARMTAEAGGPVPTWAAGVCIGSRSRIVIRADLAADNPLNSIVNTLQHEWVHLSWSRRAGANVRELPLWVEEGLAEEVGGGISVEAGAQLDFAARFGWLLDFDDIRTTWPADAGDASLAYKQGRSWVRYFRTQAGPDALRHVLAAVADGPAPEHDPPSETRFDACVFAETGKTLSYWLAAWEVQIKREADPWFYLLLRDFTGTIFFALAVLSGLGFFVLRRRRRREIEQMEDDPLPAE
jgi:hypothetical protein